MPDCPVIPRIVTASALRYVIKSAPVCVELFLPGDSARFGNIVCWDGCHNEADVGYYRRSKPPRTAGEVEAAALAVQRYRAFMASIPAADQQRVVEVDRCPRGWREAAGWYR